jgi:GNAT superfamily N-acetyltransferase
MTVGPITYRLATPADAPAIAKLHAESWRVAYRGMFPDDFLDNEVFEERARVWRERFADPRRESTTLTILAERAGDLAGFAHSIIDEDPTSGTLLDNLHVRRDAHRSGIGTRLMAETASWLMERGRSQLYLWVLEDNRGARAFYAALGGAECGRGTSPEGGSSAPSLRICWTDLSQLEAFQP